MSTHWRRLVPPLTWRKLLSCIRQSKADVVGDVLQGKHGPTLTIDGGLSRAGHESDGYNGRE